MAQPEHGPGQRRTDPVTDEESERLQKAYLDTGVFDLGDSNLDLLMTQDEEIAEALDRKRFAVEEQERVAEVAEAIAEGGAVS